MIRFELLGGSQVFLDQKPLSGFASRKVQALLIYLMVDGRLHSRDALAAFFWPESDESDAKTSLRQALFNLRKLVGDYVNTTRQTVQLDRDRPFYLDTATFQEQLALASGPALELGLAMYHGDFLAGFFVDAAPAFEEWALAQREQLRLLALHGWQRLADRATAENDVAAATLALQTLTTLDPWREETHRQLMQVLARDGQFALALRQYETCRQVLADELGVDPMPETAVLAERIRRARRLPRRHNLPPEATPFIGREEELVELMGLLRPENGRLVTILGPGGMGKTRLAIAVARQQMNAFLDGLFFIPLAGIDDPALLATAVAGACGLTLAGKQSPTEQLLAYLRDRELLLVMDNFEHLVAGTALLAMILQDAPRVKLLVTSRQRLNLREEWLFDLAGLPFPPSNEHTNLADFAAIRLFVQQARRVQRQFTLAIAETAVVELCHLVEGMPLALELAAAVGHASCQQILTELRNDMASLQTSLHNVPDRHRSLQAAFAYSWRQLSPAEQTLFQQLSVFRGSFTAAAARLIGPTTTRQLEALADKSLIQRLGNGRYQMHNLLQQYAANQLQDNSELWHQTGHSHARTFSQLLVQHEADLIGTAAATVSAQLWLDHDNIRAAWRWLVDHREVAVMETAIEGLSRYFALRGAFQEAEQLYLYSVTGLTDPTTVAEKAGLAYLLAELARFQTEQGRYDAAYACCQQAIGLDLPPTAQSGIAKAWFTMGRIGYFRSEYEQAGIDFHTALELARALELPRIEAGCLVNFGNIALAQSRFADAITQFEASIALRRRLNDRQLEGQAICNLGSAYWFQGDLDQAQSLYREALAIAEEVGDQRGQLSASGNMGVLSQRIGKLDQALLYLSVTLAATDALNDAYSRQMAQSSLGHVQRRLGQWEQAEIYYQSAYQQSQAIGHKSGMAGAAANLAALLVDRGQWQMAVPHADNGLTLVQTLNERGMEAELLHTRGRIYQAQGQLDAAGKALRAALTLYEELGVKDGRYAPLTSLANLYRQQGERRLARETVQKILDARPETPLSSAPDTVATILASYHVLIDTDPALAHALLQEGHDWLQERAGAIADATMRDSFLQNPPAHRELQTLSQ